ncbi:MAG: dihydrodipicolinate synthase family protein, partial [Solirubrobacteraceae bacterium]
LRIYAGNDDLLARVLDLGEAGGILTGSHIFGDEMRRMVDEPEHRHEIDSSLRDVYREMAIAPAACTIKAALGMIGVRAGIPRLPYVELDEDELAVVRALLERHGMLAAAA